MTYNEYKQISNAINNLKDKLFATIDKNTEETLQIIKGEIHENE